jgi:ribosomal biogenesis protein LAS1
VFFDKKFFRRNSSLNEIEKPFFFALRMFLKFRLPKITPWIDRYEWMQVYAWLFDEDGVNMGQGLRRIRAWQLRGELPLAVESTLALMDALILDRTCKVSSSCLRSAYALAIIRFVNGMADQQQKGQYAQSVALLAKSLQIPQYVVELRHLSTHESLPPLNVLRKGAEDCLSWLKEFYWDSQAEFDTVARTNIESLLQQYKKERKRHMKTSGNDSALNDACLNSANEIMDYCPEDLIELLIVPALLATGVLVPRNPKKLASLADGCLGEDVIGVWSPLLKLFFQKWSGFNIVLFESILDYISKQQLKQIIETGYAHEQNELSSLALWACFCIGYDIVSASKLLPSILKTPTFLYTRFIIRHLKENVNSLNFSESTGKVEELLSVLENDVETIPENNLIPSFEGIQKSLNENKKPVETVHSQQAGVFKTCDSSHWKDNVPLGAIPASLAKQFNISGTATSFLRDGKKIDIVTNELFIVPWLQQ